MGLRISRFVPMKQILVKDHYASVTPHLLKVQQSAWSFDLTISEYALLLKNGAKHNYEWHYFYNKDFVRDDECVRTGFGNGGDMECCRNEAKTSPFFLINTNRQMCCKDGTSDFIGACEEATVPPPVTDPIPTNIPGYGRK